MEDLVLDGAEPRVRGIKYGGVRYEVRELPSADATKYRKASSAGERVVFVDGQKPRVERDVAATVDLEDMLVELATYLPDGSRVKAAEVAKWPNSVTAQFYRVAQQCNPQLFEADLSLQELKERRARLDERIKALEGNAQSSAS